MFIFLNFLIQKVFADCGPLPEGGYILCTPLPGITQVTGPVEYIVGLYNFGLAISGIIAVGLIVWGGVNYMWARGNPSAQGEAKDRILNAVYGLLLLLGAVLLLRTIDPKLTQIKEIEIPPVPTQEKIDILSLIGGLPESVITKMKLGAESTTESRKTYNDLVDLPPRQHGEFFRNKSIIEQARLLHEIIVTNKDDLKEILKTEMRNGISPNDITAVAGQLSASDFALLYKNLIPAYHDLVTEDGVADADTQTDSLKLQMLNNMRSEAIISIFAISSEEERKDLFNTINDRGEIISNIFLADDVAKSFIEIVNKSNSGVKNSYVPGGQTDLGDLLEDYALTNSGRAGILDDYRKKTR